MIINFSIENFMSINKKQTLSFNVSEKDKLNDSCRAIVDKKYCNTIMSVLGNNASGKTNILKALSFLLWFSKHSYTMRSLDEYEPMIMPHKLSKKKNSLFELIFEKDGTEYLYKLQLNNKEIEYEYLGFKKERGFSYLYEIKKEKNDLCFLKWSDKLGKLNENDKKRFLSMKLCSLFAFLSAMGYLSSFRTDLLYPYTTNIGPRGKGTEDFFNIFLTESTLLKQNIKRREKIEKFLAECDLGFAGFDFQKSIIVRKKEGVPEKREILDLLEVKHQTSESGFSLPLLQESNGTQKVISLLDKIFGVLEKGGIAIIDELEDSLHPYLVKKVLYLFKSLMYNPLNAQILFSTHSPLLLEECTKTQIFLIEKTEDLASEAYRLDEVEGVRNCDNFCAKYLAGTYGAVPQGRWF